MTTRDIAFIVRAGGIIDAYDVLTCQQLNSFGGGFIGGDVVYLSDAGSNLTLDVGGFRVVEASLDGIPSLYAEPPATASIAIAYTPSISDPVYYGVYQRSRRTADNKIVMQGVNGFLNVPELGIPLSSAFHRCNGTTGAAEAIVLLDQTVGAQGSDMGNHRFFASTDTSCWHYTSVSGVIQFVKVSFATGAVLDTWTPLGVGTLANFTLHQVSPTKYAMVTGVYLTDHWAGSVILLDFETKTMGEAGVPLEFTPESGFGNILGNFSTGIPSRNQVRMDFGATIIKFAIMESGALLTVTCNWTTGVSSIVTSPLYTEGHYGDIYSTPNTLGTVTAFTPSGEVIVVSTVAGVWAVDASTGSVLSQEAAPHHRPGGMDNPDAGSKSWFARIFNLPVYEVSGTVTVDGLPAARKLTLLDQATGVAVGTPVVSNPTTGAYSLRCLTTAKKAVVCDAEDGTNFQVHGHLTPTALA